MIEQPFGRYMGDEPVWIEASEAPAAKAAAEAASRSNPGAGKKTSDTGVARAKD